MLYQIGNKQRVAQLIIKHFPEHDIYIEPFFGAGGIYFNKPKVKFNYLNDLNKVIFNLYMVLKINQQNFLEQFKDLPIDQALINYWRKNVENDPVYKAISFVMLSNFSHLGQMNTFSSF